MAGPSNGSYYPTEAIVSRIGRRHFQIPVVSQHWQLRSLISAEKQHVVYFPGGTGSNHVQRLNTSTKECETIKLITFAPRCLVAENGWLCCGSESGEFAAFRLEDAIDSSSSSQADAETRAARESFGDVFGANDPLLALLVQARCSNKSLVAKSMKLAKDRVNCVTLWFPPSSKIASATAYSEPVAVLANNDKTVVLVSLQDFDANEKTSPLDVVRYPDFVNRAIVSPDGRILIAILDDPYLYVHERVETEQGASTAATSTPNRRKRFHWELRHRILLKSQKKDDRSDSRGSFAAAFSPSGAYLAVGTQHGTISVFSSPLLVDANADSLVTTFTSSRPESGPGAIRDMAFCPGPFDLLAWTEDRGHVGFADMRSNFVVRQIVDINAQVDYQHIDILDRTTIDPRLLDANHADPQTSPSPPPGVGSAGNEVTRRTTESLTQALSRLNQPLSTQETMVLEAIQHDRRRRERQLQRLAEGQPQPLGVPREGSNLTTHFRNSNLQRVRQRSSSTGRGLIPSNEVGPSDLFIGSSEENHRIVQQHVRLVERLDRDGSGGSFADMLRPPRSTEERAASATARGSRNRQEPSYVRLLEILQARERSSLNDVETGDESAAPATQSVNQVVNRWEESAIRGTLGATLGASLATDHAVFEVAPSPDNTSGLAWSEDGRTLFVGAQNGIYELHINVRGRKYCPSITMS